MLSSVPSTNSSAEAALRLRLEFEHTYTGYAGLDMAIRQQIRTPIRLSN